MYVHTCRRYIQSSNTTFLKCKNYIMQNWSRKLKIAFGNLSTLSIWALLAPLETSITVSRVLPLPAQYSLTDLSLVCITYRAAEDPKPVPVKPQSRIRKTYTVYDENDIAYKVRYTACKYFHEIACWKLWIPSSKENHLKDIVLTSPRLYAITKYMKLYQNYSMYNHLLLYN